MKLAIVVGHNERAEGAQRVTDGISEYKWNSELAKMIAAHGGDDCKIFYRQAGMGSYPKEVADVYRRVDEWGATHSVELHFNANANKSAQGCETLSSGSGGSRLLAQSIQAGMMQVMGGKDRGVKVLGKKDRGYASVMAGRAPAVILEPYFGSHEKSCHKADARKAELAEAIYDSVAIIAMPVAPVKETSKPKKTWWQKVFG